MSGMRVNPDRAALAMRLRGAIIIRGQVIAVVDTLEAST
jgi:hypothetical protein